MKKLLLIALLLISVQAFTQTYKYYFFAVRPTGKAQVELTGQYPETDSILIEGMDVSKKNDTTYNYKKFANYSEVFNALSAIGLEYVEFRNLPMVGGATRMLVGDIRVDWVIFRKKVDL